MSNLWGVLAATAARSGDRTAIEVQGGATLGGLSYSTLATRAEAVARWLAGTGVGAGDRCAILADNGAAWCTACLGVLRRGAVAVPLDTSGSTAQVAAIVADAGARVLLAGSRQWDTAREAAAGLQGVRVVPIDGPFDVDGRQALEPCPATWSDPAVILYTSGTTAGPKGVVLSHANLHAERSAALEVVDVNEEDSVLGVLPLSHALGLIANLILPLTLGARVVFLETINTIELLRALREREISILVCVPQHVYLIHERVRADTAQAGLVARALFGTLLAVSRGLRRTGVNPGPVLFRRAHKRLGRRMRLLVTGGSKFDPEIGAELYALGFTILQAYGLTETSGAATISRPDEAHIDTVGRPLPGVEIRILAPGAGEAEDEASEPQDGEIAIGGPIVMQGYFNQPDATSAVLRDGWLLTGDLGRLDAHGRLTITGRSREAIVLASGKTLHPDEIEAHYCRCPFIREVCVLGLTGDDAPRSERLHAVIVPDEKRLRAHKVANAGDLLRFEIEGLTAALPAHKRVLGYDIRTEPLPRTTTGELRRHEIARQLSADVQTRRTRADRPLTPDEEAWLADSHVASAVAVIRARVRGGTPVVPAASLELDLGFDSMERVELITELEQRFGVRIDQDHAHEVLTARQLVEAVRPSAGGGAPGEFEEPWAALLRDLPPPDDPVLGSLLESRRVFAPLAYVGVRLVRLALTLGRLDVTGLEHLPNRGPCILCPNHQSYLDPIVLCGLLPFRALRDLFFVGATEYFASPPMRRLARQINLVPVDPDANLVSAMKAGAFGLSHGKILVLFPEGERSIDGSVKRFKKGAPILARHMSVPIVPVAISGLFEIWPRNRSLNLRQLLPWTSPRVRISFGPPMTFDGSDSPAEATARLRAAVADLWEAQHEPDGSRERAKPRITH